MRRLAKVNDLEKLRSNFYLLVFGGVAGAIPRRGGSGKAVGFEAWGRLPPFKFTRVVSCAIRLGIVEKI
jgi:hypothetical protein